MLLRQHRVVVLGATALLLAAALAAIWPGHGHPGWATALALLWLGTPLWIGLAGTPLFAPAASQLADADRAWLLAVARDTWRWFEQHVGPATHALPPDNVQTSPTLVVAQRTSPTNIGLYLLAVACARQHGWISTTELLARCNATLDTLDRLPRHRGHVLNWIDTATLAPLAPQYVSTVDSGNLCLHLLALAGACDAVPDADAGAGAGAAADTPLRAPLQALAARCRAQALAAEFGFLYDTRRRLFHIGLRVTDQVLDRSYYDLLASEARQASLWAIAKGDVPASHWAALGRPFFAQGLQAGLRSWSGSMFEYLMPTLVLAEPAGCALASANLTAVRLQMSYGRARGVPWGLSESAYAARDHTLAYQYAPQGVPRLALRRSPPDDLVVAPYASAMAAMLLPAAASANLHRLQDLGARSAGGFIEALDYSAERQSDASPFTLVHTGMAHHQGMVLVALSNLLCDNAAQRWTMADPRLAAVAPLLQERVPREVARLPEPAPAYLRDTQADAGPGQVREVLPGATALQPTALLSNGRYSVTLRANGAGSSRFGQADVTRWRDDALRDAYGSFCYLRRTPGTTPVSITQHPAPDPAAHYQARFLADHVVLEALWPDLRVVCTVWVSPEDDIELRRVELWNTSSEGYTLELISMLEPVLTPARADEAHPAFTNLFISADWVAEEHALHLARRPRLADEPGLHAVHFVAQHDSHLLSVQPQASRMAWRGRGRSAAAPLALHPRTAVASGPLGTALDPVAALSMQIALPAHGTAHVTLCTAAAVSREQTDTLVDRYRQRQLEERSALMSATGP